MICPKCEYEYVEGVTECVDCGTELIPVEQFEGNLTHPEDWVILETFSEPYEAEMLKANLNGADIEALVWSQKDRNYPSPGDLSIVKLLVKKEDAENALTILNDINSQSETNEEEE